MARTFFSSRRHFLRVTGLGVTGLAAGCVPDAGDDTALDTGDTGDTGDPGACDLTVPQTEGPYYEAGAPEHDDLDLFGEGGTPLTFHARVVGEDCGPIAGAVVDLWHANTDGDYDDIAPQSYRGTQTTDDDGWCTFTTRKPGHYEVDANWTRPAHLHLKVWVDGTQRVTTQLYFETDPFNAEDALIDDRLIMAEVDDGAGGIICEYELTVR